MIEITFNTAASLFLIGIILGVWIILSINLIKAIVRLLRPKPSYGWVVFPKNEEWVVLAWVGTRGYLVDGFESHEEATSYARKQIKEYIFKQQEQ